MNMTLVAEHVEQEISQDLVIATIPRQIMVDLTVLEMPLKLKFVTWKCVQVSFFYFELVDENYRFTLELSNIAMKTLILIS